MKKMKSFSDGGVMRGAMRCRRSFWATVFGTIAIICTATSASAAGGDKGKIVFVSDRTGSWQIYTMNPDGTDQFQVTNLEPTDDDGIFPSLSPDGQSIAFNYNAGEGPDLFVINVSGTGLRQITNDHGSFFPRWSPDGKRLAFATASEFGTGVIVTMPADGNGMREVLTTNLWESFAPIYTPDGKQIVFQSTMGGFVSAVWIMNVDGSHQRRLTAPALKGAATSISPDGKYILLFSNSSTPAALPNENFVMKLNGSGLKRLAPLAEFHHELGASFSPDGKSISFYSDRYSHDITEFTYGTFDIVTMNADGTNLIDILPAAGFCPFDGNCVDASWGPSPHE